MLRRGCVLMPLLYMATVAAFAWWYSDHPGGLACVYDPKRTADFWDCLYFSIITVTSVGYGDMRPTGGCRFVAGLEAVFGLVFLGVIISQLVSARSDRILDRLYRRTGDTAISNIVAELRDLTKEYDELRLKLGHAKIGLATSRRMTSYVRSTHSIHDDLLQLSTELLAHVDSSIERGEFLESVSRESMARVFDGVQGVLSSVLSIWDSLSQDKRAKYFKHLSRLRVRAAANKLDHACFSILDCDAQGVWSAKYTDASSVISRCKGLPKIP